MMLRVNKFASKTLLTKSERAEIARFRLIAKRHVEKVTQTPESARQELIDAGIYQPDGQLAKQYR